MDLRIGVLFLIVLVNTISAQTTAAPASESGPAAPVVTEDKCAKVTCKDGEICEDGNCNCIDVCPQEWNNAARQLCIDDKTYRHECDYYRNKCYCAKNDARCGGKEFNGHKPSASDTIMYFDSCTQLGSMCSWDTEKDTFHERLARWFQQIFSTKWSVASSRSEDNSLLKPLTAKARTAAMKLFNAPTKSTYGVHGGYLSFWFCEMDRNNDGSINKQEAALLSQLLNPSTPCLNTFLSKCGSGTISSDAWHTCFKAPKEEVIACSEFN